MGPVPRRRHRVVMRSEPPPTDMAIPVRACQANNSRPGASRAALLVKGKANDNTAGVPGLVPRGLPLYL
jgi:hypothetical protein